MITRIIFIIICFTLWHPETRTSPLLIVRFKAVNDIRDSYTILKQLEKPGTHDLYVLQKNMNHQTINGIFATYAGYLGISNLDGMLTFPIKHSSPSILLVITKRIIPITITSNTVDHWELNPEFPAVLYQIKQDKNTKTGAKLWHTKEISRPADNILPPEALIIIANPDHVIINTGDTPFTPSPHLMLPQIGVKRSINQISNALYTMNLSHFFTPVPFANQKKPTRVIKQVGKTVQEINVRK